MRVLTKMKRLVSKPKNGKDSRQNSFDDIVNALPPKKDSHPKKRLDKGRSTPAINISPRKKIGPRSSSQPVLAAFVPAYVDQLKAQPFSLKEKISRWCKKSPMALYKAHEPPLDHDMPFPVEPYEDKMCDEFGRSLILEEEAKNSNAPTTKPRMECVLQRYTPNRHGILSSYDRGDIADKANGDAKKPISNPTPSPRNHKIAMPPPSFDSNVRKANLNQPPAETSLSKPPPPCPKRVPTNLSMIPHRCMSHLDEKMLARALSTMQENVAE